MVSVKIDFRKKDFVWIGLVVVLLGAGLAIAQWDTAKAMFHDSEDVKITIGGLDYSLQNASDLGWLGGGMTYDSGWFAVSQGGTYSKTHDLGTTNLITKLYFATNNSGLNMCDTSYFRYGEHGGQIQQHPGRGAAEEA